MASRQFWTIIGVAAVGGGAYYFYQAGGDPKAAEKRFEADAAKVGRQLGVAGKGDELKKDSQVLAADAGKKIDDVVSSTKQGISQVDKKLETYRKEAEKAIDTKAKEVNASAKSAVDQFDKSVTEGASKAKSSVSSWFGGSK